MSVKLAISAQGMTRLPIGRFLYVPQLTYSLISIPVLDGLGYRTLITGGKLRVTYQKRVILAGTLINGLYYLDSVYVKLLVEGDTLSDNMVEKSSGTSLNLKEFNSALPVLNTICEVPLLSLKRSETTTGLISSHLSRKQMLADTVSAGARESEVCATASRPLCSEFRMWQEKSNGKMSADPVSAGARESEVCATDSINLTYEGLIPKIQKSMLSKDVDALQPHIRAFVERAVTFTTCPECDGTRLSRGGPVVEDRGDQHRRRLRDADQRPRRVGARASTSRRWRRCWTALRADPRLVRRDRARLPLARPAVGHAVGRRGAAHQDDPPPRLLAHRRHLRLRRADHRAAPARHPADERPAAAAARQGQHRAGRRAQAGGDRDRRPRRRPRPRRRHRRRRGGVRGHRRGAAGQRHDHRPAPGRPGRARSRRCGRRRACWRCAAPTPTTCRTSTSTSRSACWSWSPAWPARARAR